jgi:branched-chain amino acid transport system substrate-binding protein
MRISRRRVLGHVLGSTVAAAALGGAGARAQQPGEVKIGVLLSFTGGLAPFSPVLRDSARLLASQVNAMGGILDGKRLVLVEADDQTNPQAAVTAASRLVDVENVAGLVGPLSSSAVLAAANAVAIPRRIVLISPSATNPTISDLQDNDYVFRTAVPDSLQGRVLAREIRRRNLSRVAVLAVNNAYGTGLLEVFRAQFQAAGGTLTHAATFEENRPAYRGELATAASGNPEALVLIGFPQSGGTTVLKQALENGFFSKFIFTDGMREASVAREVGAGNLRESWGTMPASTAEGALQNRFYEAFRRTSQLDPTGAYAAEIYDSTMLLALAIQSAGSVEREKVRDHLRRVANAAQGAETIGPGDWGKARDVLGRGGRINYEGASGPCEFDEKGDVVGRIGIWRFTEPAQIVTDRFAGPND